MSGIKEHCFFGRVVGSVQRVLETGFWIYPASIGTVCLAVSWDVFGVLETGFWPRLASQRTVCRVVCTTWSRVCGLVSGHAWHVRELYVE